jgi:hypothetical protein
VITTVRVKDAWKESEAGMRRALQSEQGVALLTALGAMVILGVLVAGIVFVATQDARIGGNTVRQARAAAAAELGLNRVPVDWNPAVGSGLKTGDTLQKVYTAPGGTSATVVLTRLPGPFVWAVSEGKAGVLGSQASARRRYGMLFRLDIPSFNPLGAITTQGLLIVSGNATVSGNDVTPTGWGSCSTKTVAGVAMADMSKLNTKGACSSKNCIQGTPQYLQTALAADTSTYFVYGSETYQTLAATANLTFPGGSVLGGIGPVVSGGKCVKSTTTNWGDPTRHSPAGACEGYYPAIHALGDLKLSTGVGEGILLVDGNLTVTGNFQFTGAVIVRGTYNSYGNGNKVTGAVWAANMALDDNDMFGNGGIQYSSCALLPLLQGRGYPKQAKQRGWVNLY